MKLFDVNEEWDDVLEEIAELLDLDPHHLAHHGRFVSNKAAFIGSLNDLQPGMMHELTLVIS